MPDEITRPIIGIEHRTAQEVFDIMCERFRGRLPSLPSDIDGLVEELKKRKDAAYEERNKVVAALAHLFPSGIKNTDIPGWSPDWHGCVYIDLPTGQVSWHFHDSQRHLFDGLAPYKGEWDGHDTEEKYRRLAALRARQAPEGVVEAVDTVIDKISGEFLPGGPVDIKGILRRVKSELRAALSAMPSGAVKVTDGLSEWQGWDQSREPWGETKHKDAVLEALFRGPWSAEDAATLIGFIDRTWTKRPGQPS